MRDIKRKVERAVMNARNALMSTITSVIKKDAIVYTKVSDEEIRDIKVISPYGLFSLPLNGQMGQVIFNNTSKKASLIGIVHEKLPVDVNPGETLIYSKSGSYILLKSDGKLYFKGDLIVTGNITTTGNINASGNVTGANI